MDPTTVSTVTNLIGSLGFPIVCCAMLFWQQNKTMANFADRMEDAIKVLNTTLEANTTAVTTLLATVETLAKVGKENG